MKKLRIAEPNYEFVVVDVCGKDIVGQSYLTEELAILKCMQGEAIVSVNTRIHQFKTNANFLLPDAMHFSIVECSHDFQIRACRFDMKFLNEVYPVLDNKVIDTMQYNSPDLSDGPEAEITDLTFRKLCLLNGLKDHAYRHRIAVNLVVNYILEIYELTRRRVESNAVSKSSYVNKILASFFVMCVDHHAKHRNVEFYANQLNISSRYLSKMTQEATQLTPKQIIDYYVTGAIKRLLLTTALSNQQIADELYFPDHATLGQFFKRNVGISLSEFRNQYR